MKNVLVCCFFLFTAAAFSQGLGSIKGTIMDQAMNNEPLLFAHIQLNGIATNYLTNFHGNFEITEITPGTHILVVSYAGYETQEIEVVVKENEITQVFSEIALLQVDFDTVVGMDTSLKEDTPRK